MADPPSHIFPLFSLRNNKFEASHHSKTHFLLDEGFCFARKAKFINLHKSEQKRMIKQQETRNLIIGVIHRKTKEISENVILHDKFLKNFIKVNTN